MQVKLYRTAGSLLALLSLTAASPAAAQGYPTRPVRILVGLSAGSGVDVAARIVGQKITERWGQQVVIDNRPGAGSNIAMEIVAKATPDGYVAQAFARIARRSNLR